MVLAGGSPAFAARLSRLFATWCFAVTFVCLLGGSQLVLYQTGLSTASVRIASQSAVVELALTEEQRRKGLSFRASHSLGDSMLFVFDTPFTLTFSMRDTLLPLSIGFFGADCTLNSVREMHVDSKLIYSSDKPSLLALEMPSGWFTQSGVVVGDELRLSSVGKVDIDLPCTQS